jgi:hypothetical protein
MNDPDLLNKIRDFAKRGKKNNATFAINYNGDQMNMELIVQLENGVSAVAKATNFEDLFRQIEDQI